ncbi:MAG: hypothetical protein ACLVB5_08160 [Christensenellales bacterium]
MLNTPETWSKPLDVAAPSACRTSAISSESSAAGAAPWLAAAFCLSVRARGSWARPIWADSAGHEGARWRICRLRKGGLAAAGRKLARSAANAVVLGVCGGYPDARADDARTTRCAWTALESPCRASRRLGACRRGRRLTAQKRRAHVAVAVVSELRAPFAGARMTGYEIHNGRTTVNGSRLGCLADGTPEGCVVCKCVRRSICTACLTARADAGAGEAAVRAQGDFAQETRRRSMAAYRQAQFDAVSRRRGKALIGARCIARWNQV